MKLKNKKTFKYKGPVFDLNIKSKDHSYNVEGLTVHNSAAGSFVAYLLSITGLDPIEHNLLFERFINEHRKVMCLTEENYIKLLEDKKKIMDLNKSDLLDTVNKNDLILINENDYEGEVICFEQGDVKIEVTPTHIIPVIRNNEEIEIQAQFVLESDSLIFKNKG